MSKESKSTKVYVPLDWFAAGKSLGGDTRKEDPLVFGPVAGKVVEISILKEAYANEVRNNPNFGKRGGKIGVADVGTASIRVNWWVKNIFPVIV